jgi:Winged helix-turn-helix DNA-binding
MLALLQPAVGDTVSQDQRSRGVAERTEGAQTYRYSISVEATERELRLCGFALLNHFLTMHHVIAEHVRLPPIELLILIATTTGNVQRALRPEALPEALRGSKPLPPELAVPMSRRAIARVTGIPTETVRRHVERMVERGILVSTAKGVRAPNRLTERWAAAATLQLIESHAACTEKLIALQAIAPQPPRSAKSKRG